MHALDDDRHARLRLHARLPHVPVSTSKTRRAAVLSLLLRGRMGPEERAALSDPREVSARAAHAIRLPIA